MFLLNKREKFFWGINFLNEEILTQPSSIFRLVKFSSFLCCLFFLCCVFIHLRRSRDYDHHMLDFGHAIQQIRRDSGHGVVGEVAAGKDVHHV